MPWSSISGSHEPPPRPLVRQSGWYPYHHRTRDRYAGLHVARAGSWPVIRGRARRSLRRGRDGVRDARRAPSLPRQHSPVDPCRAGDADTSVTRIDCPGCPVALAPQSCAASRRIPTSAGSRPRRCWRNSRRSRPPCRYLRRLPRSQGAVRACPAGTGIVFALAAGYWFGPGRRHAAALDPRRGDPAIAGIVGAGPVGLGLRSRARSRRSIRPTRCSRPSARCSPGGVVPHRSPGATVWRRRTPPRSRPGSSRAHATRQRAAGPAGSGTSSQREPDQDHRAGISYARAHRHALTGLVIRSIATARSPRRWCASRR
jgi:hypothetical protein